MRQRAACIGRLDGSSPLNRSNCARQRATCEIEQPWPPENEATVADWLPEKEAIARDSAQPPEWKQLQRLMPLECCCFNALVPCMIVGCLGPW